MTSQPPLPHHDVAIIGSGFSGLGMAVNLMKAGRNDFILFEKEHDVGGTWLVNHYPGAACDVPSHLYSFSFEPNPKWSRMFSPQPEILRYLKHCADKYGVTPRVRYNSEVIECRWHEDRQHWSLRTADGYAATARVLVSAVGGLSRPAMPRVPGLQNFKGTVFHSAEWNHDYDLHGKRVAVIGTGASAIQFVPQIVKQVGQLHLFQRTPPWIVPKADGSMASGIKAAFTGIPGLQKLLRAAIYWQNEAFALGFVNPRLMKAFELVAKWHLSRQVKNKELRAKLTPNYTIGCKRVLLSNNYYPALTKPNVNVIASGVSAIREHSVVDSQGREYEVDAIICGTGFDVADPLGPLRIYARDGKEVRKDIYRDGLTAYLGITMHELPNAFFLLGPNTGLGHTSIIFMIEAQINYITQALAAMDRKQARTLEVKQEVQDAFNRKTQESLKKMVWGAGGCKSWYVDEQGRNLTLWPGFTWKYWLDTRSLNVRDFTLAKARAS